MAVWGAVAVELAHFVWEAKQEGGEVMVKELRVLNDEEIQLIGVGKGLMSHNEVKHAIAQAQYRRDIEGE